MAAQVALSRVYHFATSCRRIRHGNSEADLLSNQLAPDMQGASVRINHKAWNETLESELAAVVWFKKGDMAVRPKVTYAFTDRFKGIIGGNLYRGPSQSFFGELRRVSTAYAEFQIGF